MARGGAGRLRDFRAADRGRHPFGRDHGPRRGPLAAHHGGPVLRLRSRPGRDRRADARRVALGRQTRSVP